MVDPYTIANRLKKHFVSSAAAISYAEKIARNARRINPTLSNEYLEAAQILKSAE